MLLANSVNVWCWCIWSGVCVHARVWERETDRETESRTDTDLHVHASICQRRQGQWHKGCTPNAGDVYEKTFQWQKYRLERISLERRIFVRNTFSGLLHTTKYAHALTPPLLRTITHTGAIWEALIWTSLGQIKAYELQLSPSGSELAQLACNWWKTLFSIHAQHPSVWHKVRHTALKSNSLSLLTSGLF